LAECPAWLEARRALAAVIGEDFSLPVIVTQMVDSENAWKAVSSFCGHEVEGGGGKREAARGRR